MLTTRWFKDSDIEQQQEYFGDWYDCYEKCEGEPFSITVHETWDAYGGPEEGGWYFRCGFPLETICIFSKDQAIRELIRLHEKYNTEEDQEKKYDISLARSYATWYPKKRPHYE